MKTNKFVEELKAKSVKELSDELEVTARSRIPPIVRRVEIRDGYQRIKNSGNNKFTYTINLAGLSRVLLYFNDCPVIG